MARIPTIVSTIIISKRVKARRLRIAGVTDPDRGRLPASAVRTGLLLRRDPAGRARSVRLLKPNHVERKGAVDCRIAVRLDATV